VAKFKNEIGKRTVSQLENIENQQYLIKHTGWAKHVA
jgi:hypothetical protein